ncbi:MAG: hypothetical protein AB7K41_14525 [Bdellovibrionales bacterium]
MADETDSAENIEEISKDIAAEVADVAAVAVERAEERAEVAEAVAEAVTEAAVESEQRRQIDERFAHYDNRFIATEERLDKWQTEMSQKLEMQQSQTAEALAQIQASLSALTPTPSSPPPMPPEIVEEPAALAADPEKMENQPEAPTTPEANQSPAVRKKRLLLL